MTPGDKMSAGGGEAPLAALEAALDRAALAAREAGIEPDDALGVWAASLRAATHALAALMERGEAWMRATVADVADAAKADRERMRAATEHCRATTQKLEATFGTLQARADNLMTQAIASMAERVADKASVRISLIVGARFARWWAPISRDRGQFGA